MIRKLAALLPATALVCGLLHAAAPAPPALAAGTQLSILQDGSVYSDPVGGMQELRHLGVRVVRVFVRWSSIAPQATSHRRPRFNAASPAAYPRGAFDSLDAIVRAAAADDMDVLFTVTGGAPEWADGRGAPAVVNSNDLYAWNPSTSQFGQFVRALGSRYGGSFRPCGGCGPLPPVRYWELFNEPNFGEDLGPQAIDGSRILNAPNIFRRLAGAAWSALSATGHRHDTIILGGLAARGATRRPTRSAPQGLPGNFGETKPLSFIRAVYCLDGRYRPYRGHAAALRGCPRTAAASRRFRRQNPALFDATAYGIHPYPLGTDTGLPPNRTASPDPSYAALSQLPHMAQVLDHVDRVYRSRGHMAIWNTEYGYITNPPNNLDDGVSPATQALYLNWAEYISWRNPRIQSFSQYLLEDPNPANSGFASGLLFFGGRPKQPGYDAWRLPLFLPRTSARRGASLHVWGCVRPAYYAQIDTGAPQTAQIQFLPSGSTSGWETMRSVTIHGSSCYFDVPVKFPGSGTVRLAYTYPPNDPRLLPTILRTYVDPLSPAQSRPVTITIN